MPPKKPEAPKTDYFVEIVWFLVIVFFLWMVFQRIQYLLEYYDIGSYHSLWAAVLVFFLTHILPMIKILGAIIIVASVFGIQHSYKKLKKIVLEEKALYGPKVVVNEEIVSVPKNPKWERVVAHSDSLNPSDWKLAIIEADTMLDDLLKASGYHGDSLGERLKAVEKSDFLTIDYAWDAHKVRNQIAHEGTSFELNNREAKRIIALYEAVFREFKVI